MILLSAAESRELDRLSQTKYGIPSFLLMTRAGEAVARAVARRWPDAMAAGVIVVAGKGNNGGDGLVAARKLHQAGENVCVMLLAQVGDLTGDAARAHSEYVDAGGTVIELVDPEMLEREAAGVVIDALLGTGLNAEVRGAMREVIEAINRLGRPVVAVDLPSGLNADTGAVMGVAVNATVTVTFGYPKYGHVSYPGAALCCELEVVDIGFAPAALVELSPAGRLIERAEAASLIVPRAVDTHKGTYGHALIVAGGRGKSGAAILAARGALRSGAGLVTAAIPECVAPIVAGGQPELMTEPMPDRDGHFAAPSTIPRLSDLLTGKTTVIAGPGIGVSDDSRDLIRWLIRDGVAPDRPLLIDADGLNALALIGPRELKSAPGPVVLTPHPGEMARLLGSTTAAVNADRIGAARKLVDLTGAHVLLKGARSVIAAPDGVVHINSSGNPGMATGGMGDVLAGIVGALMGQGLVASAALTLGVFIHGHAADCLAARVGRFGYLAGDIAAELPAAFDAIIP
jgi:ADP-dependent NAD(P)H-hydrate dehydratase / NAD(P)H-hydrate epimerase